MALSMNRHKLKANRQTELYQTVMHDLIKVCKIPQEALEEYIGFKLKYPDDSVPNEEE